MALGQRGRIVLAMALVGGCLLAQPTYANATSLTDRAATHTYLQATYTLGLALVRNTAKTSPPP